MEDDDDIPGILGDMLRLGTIESVDLAAATATVTVGAVETPPLPWAEWAGDFRTWRPPVKDEQVLIFCPDGDIAGGIIRRGLFTAARPAPSADATPGLFGKGGLAITLTPDGVQIVVPGGATLTGDLTMTGNLTVTGTVTASEDVTGGGISLKSHKHGGVQAGSAQSGDPV